MVTFGLLEKLYFEVLLVKKLKTSQGTNNVEILLHRVRRGLSECQPRRRPEEVVAEAGVSYIETLLDLTVTQQEEGDDCVKQKVCHTARHVAGLTDQVGLVDSLNKILIKATALHLMETKHMEPRHIIAAGDWGRAWQDCHQKYICSAH